MDSSEEQGSTYKEQWKVEGDESLKEEEDLHMEEHQERENEEPEPLTQDEGMNMEWEEKKDNRKVEPLTQDEQEIRRFEMGIGEFHDDHDHPDKAYCFTANEAWVEVKNKSNLKNKIYLADSGANAYTVSYTHLTLPTIA